jgi:hypothetical protein
MELSPYLDGLRRDLTAAAAPGGAEVARAAELLGGSLEASARLCLLEALSDAAAEITSRLTRATVDVQLRGREAHLVVTEREPVADVQPAAAAPQPEGGGGEPPEPGDLVRMTLRLPESLKEAVERAAAAEAISVNAWLVRILSQVLSGAGPTTPPPPGPPPGRGRLGRRVTGYAQS